MASRKKPPKLVDKVVARAERRELFKVVATLITARTTAHFMAKLMETLYMRGMVDLDTCKTYYVHANAVHHWATNRIKRTNARIEELHNGI